MLEAYSVLEADGLVSAKRGSGYFINTPSTNTPSINTQAINTQAINTQAINTQAIHAQIAQSQRPSDCSENCPKDFQSAASTLLKPSFYPLPDIYAASLHSHARTDYIDFGIGFPQPSGLDDLQRIARRAMKKAHTFFHSFVHDQTYLIAIRLRSKVTVGNCWTSGMLR